jgi:hypothetical protein
VRAKTIGRDPCPIRAIFGARDLSQIDDDVRKSYYKKNTSCMYFKETSYIVLKKSILSSITHSKNFPVFYGANSFESHEAFRRSSWMKFSDGVHILGSN